MSPEESEEISAKFRHVLKDKTREELIEIALYLNIKRDELFDTLDEISEILMPFPGSTPVMQAQVRMDERASLEAKLAVALAERDVWSGEACQEEQAAGNGPCGSCRYCLPKLVSEARADSTMLRGILKKRGHALNCTRGVYKDQCNFCSCGLDEAMRNEDS